MGFWGNFSQMSGGNNISGTPSGQPSQNTGSGMFGAAGGPSNNPLFRIVQMFQQLAQQGGLGQDQGNPHGGFAGMDGDKLGSIFQNAMSQNASPTGNVNTSAQAPTQGGNGMLPNQGRGAAFNPFTARFGS
jgi:hypothetical protein